MNSLTKNVVSKTAAAASLILLAWTLALSASAQQIKLYPSSIRLDKGKTRTVTAVALDAAGHYIPNKVFTFSLNSGSSAAASIRMSPEGTTSNGESRWSGNLGEITGLSAGEATFTATVDGIVSSPLSVTVVDPAAAPQAIIKGDNDAEGGQTIRVRV